MFHPFRNEYQEITTQDLRLKYQKIQDNPLEREKLESQIRYYQPYQELLEGIEDYINQQQEDDELEDNEEYEDTENQILEENNDELELETHELKDIKDFVKESDKEVEKETGLWDKKSLLERIGQLNKEQRLIFDDIVSRLISGDFLENQFLIYIRYCYFVIDIFKFYALFQWRCRNWQKLSFHYYYSSCKTCIKGGRGHQRST